MARKIRKRKIDPGITRPQLQGVPVGGCPVSEDATALAGKPDKAWRRATRAGLPCQGYGKYLSTVDAKPNRALLGQCPYCREWVWLVRTTTDKALYAAYCGNSGMWLWAGAGRRRVFRTAAEALG